jgi:hypothetical protein
MASRINELELYVSNRGEDNQLVDWTKAAGSLTSGIATAAGMRQLRRAENEQVKKSAEDVVGKNENLTDQSLQKFQTNGAFAGRDKIVELNNLMKNGEISRAQHKSALANISTNWKNTADYMKNLDKLYAEKLDRKEKGLASKAELELVEYIGQLNNIGDKAITFDNNGNVLVAIMDKNGKPTGAYQDINALNNMMNATIDTVDVDGIISVKTKEWDEWQQRNKTDIRLSGNLWTNNVKVLVNDILVDSRSTTAVLTDYAGMGTYFDEEEKATALEKLRRRNPNATEADLIFGKQDAKGYVTYTLTQDQVKRAEDLVKNKIEQQFGSKVDYPPGYGTGVAASAKADASAGQRQATAKNGYISTLKAFGWNPSEFIGNNKIVYTKDSKGKTKYDFSGLNRSYEYKRDNRTGHIKVYKIGETESFFTATSPAELQNYAYGTELEDEAKKLANEARVLFGVTKRDKPTINKGKAKAKTKVNY